MAGTGGVNILLVDYEFQIPIFWLHLGGSSLAHMASSNHWYYTVAGTVQISMH